jgi:hypothetical protein
VNGVVNEWDLPEIGLRGLSARDRKMFWDGFVALRPEIGYRWGNTFARWRAVPGTEFNLSLYITNRSVGLFVRGVRHAVIGHAGATRAAQEGTGAGAGCGARRCVSAAPQPAADDDRPLDLAPGP